MDEQMIRSIALAINNARYDYLADDYEPTEHELHVAAAAHSVMAGKVAELTEALEKMVAFGEEVERKNLVGDEGCYWPVEIARAALAPYPERRHE